MGSFLAVTLEVVADVRRLEACSLPYSDRHELTGPHEAVHASARDAEKTGNVGDREQVC
jgi:hypothetical protein